MYSAHSGRKSGGLRAIIARRSLYNPREYQADQKADALALSAGTQLLSAKRAKTGKRKPARHEGRLTDFMLELFNYQIDFKLSGQVDANRRGQLRDVRASTEKSRIDLENQFANRDIQVMEFVLRSDLETINFQKQAARVVHRLNISLFLTLSLDTSLDWPIRTPSPLHTRSWLYNS